MTASHDILEATDPSFTEWLEEGSHALCARVSKAEDPRAAGMLTTALIDCILEGREHSPLGAWREAYARNLAGRAQEQFQEAAE